jgi:hypothetical protein
MKTAMQNIFDNVFITNLLVMVFSFIDLTFITKADIEFVLRCVVMFCTILYTTIQILSKLTTKKNDV